MGRTEFEEGLTRLINSESMEQGSDTPDYVLASYLMRCLDAWNCAQADRKHWHRHPPKTVAKWESLEKAFDLASATHQVCRSCGGNGGGAGASCQRCRGRGTTKVPPPWKTEMIEDAEAVRRAQHPRYPEHQGTAEKVPYQAREEAVTPVQMPAMPKVRLGVAYAGTNPPRCRVCQGYGYVYDLKVINTADAQFQCLERKCDTCNGTGISPRPVPAPDASCRNCGTDRLLKACKHGPGTCCCDAYTPRNPVMEVKGNPYPPGEPKCVAEWVKEPELK